MENFKFSFRKTQVFIEKIEYKKNLCTKGSLFCDQKYEIYWNLNAVKICGKQI